MSLPTQSDQSGLTPRESEILKLLATGCTNRQMGKILGIATGTVERHVHTILLKLHLANRTEAARWAARHHLVDQENGQ